MSRGTDISRLLAVAIRDEQSGAGFYRTLSEGSDAKEVRELFSWLAEQEKKHEARFGELARTIEKESSPEHFPDEHTGYLEWLVSEGGSPSVRKELDSCRTDSERIALAIRFEREQLALQQDLGSFIAGEYQPVVKNVIDEERAHIVRLSRELER